MRAAGKSEDKCPEERACLSLSGQHHSAHCLQSLASGTDFFNLNLFYVKNT